MQKIITGPPRAGKTLFAIREIILKNYEWDKTFCEWKLKPGIDSFTLITNIDGLKIPHINIDEYLADHKIDCSIFFTIDYFERVLLVEHSRILILLDEAHGYFPSNFKDKIGDKRQSCFFFFGYHGHYPIDIYLITHHWTDLPQGITHKCEYQIDATKRSLTAVGEFRYNYMSGMEVVEKITFMPDKRLFAIYDSNRGSEYHSNTIRPLRRMMMYFLALIVIGGVFSALFYRLYAGGSDDLLDKPEKLKKSVSGSLSDVAKKRAVPSANPVGQPVPQAFPASAPVGLSAPVSGMIPPVVSDQSFVQVSTGGAWIGGRLVAIDLFGSVVRVADFPYTYTEDSANRRVLVQVPDSALAALRPGLWIDSARVLASNSRDREKIINKSDDLVSGEEKTGPEDIEYRNSLNSLDKKD